MDNFLAKPIAYIKTLVGFPIAKPLAGNGYHFNYSIRFPVVLQSETYSLTEID